uniref:Uncharacterized protein n=1 Tax=Anopheles culicifacies TaxID=139723 RepID=A0A182MRS8_9DIPT
MGGSIVWIKIEPQELDTELVSALNDQEFANHATFVSNTKPEHPIDDDIDLEATRITPSCGTDDTSYAAVQIKVEAQDSVSDQEQDVSKDTIESGHESSLPEKVLKFENEPFDMEAQSPTSVQNPTVPNAEDPSEIHDDGTANQNKRVYAEGMMLVVQKPTMFQLNNHPTVNPQTKVGCLGKQHQSI